VQNLLFRFTTKSSNRRTLRVPAGKGGATPDRCFTFLFNSLQRTATLCKNFKKEIVLKRKKYLYRIYHCLKE